MSGAIKSMEAIPHLLKLRPRDGRGRVMAERLRPEFMAFMDAHDDQDLPPGAWQGIMVSAAEAFILDNKLRWVDPDNAWLDWIKWGQSEGAGDE